MIDAIVLFASHDARFFKSTVGNLLSSGLRVHVVTYTHLWRGQPENISLLDDTISEFSYHTNFYSYRVTWKPGESPWYWEAVGRSFPLNALPADSEYCLFIDMDEIVEVEKFKTWLSTNEYRMYDSMTISTYWYFRDPTFRANVIHDGTVMCKTELAKLQSSDSGVRKKYIVGKSAQGLASNDVFIHHYGWVRTKEELFSKTNNWGHYNENSWESLIETEFSEAFSGKDFVHGYSYTIVPNIFNI